MKKTVSITISGIIFNIEEDGYGMLRRYLDTISGYFTQNDGRDEIMSDIESRIAELFQERISSSKEVVTVQDVDDVIDIMGRPEDYVEEEPSHHSDGQRHSGNKKKVYRDMDNEVLGGICAGLSHYFGIDVVWVRLLFVVFALTFGVTIILYILLWFIVPPARTTAEKLEMRGEPVNIENIKKKVSETFDEMTSIDSKSAGRRLVELVEGFFRFLGQMLRGLFHVLGKFFGSLFLLISLTLFIAIIYSLLDSGSVNISGFPLQQGPDIWADALFNSTGHKVMSYLGLALGLFAPLLIMLILGTRLVFNRPERSRRYLGALGLVWVLGLIISTVSGLGLAKEYIEEEEVTHRHELEVSGDTLYVSIADDARFLAQRDRYFDAGDQHPGLVQIEGDSIYFGYPTLRIEQHRFKDDFEFELRRSASGAGRSAAYDRADRIVYAHEFDGRQLSLSTFFSASLLDKVRGQECDVTLRVPVGKTIYLDKDIHVVLDDVDTKQNLRIRDLEDEYWQMTDEGLTLPEGELPASLEYAL